MRPKATSSAAAAQDHFVKFFQQLTEAEWAVLRLMAVGLTNNEIGIRIYRTGGTVKTHVRGIMAKLGTRSRTATVALYLLSSVSVEHHAALRLELARQRKRHPLGTR